MEQSNLFNLFIMGIVLGVAVAMVIKAGRKSLNCEFDERQLLERGNAYKWGFFTAIIELCLGFVTRLLEIDILKGIPADTVALTAFILPIAVFSCYAIMKDAFMGITKVTEKRMYVIYAAVFACNLFAFVLPLALHGTNIENLNWANLSMSILFGMILFACIVKNRVAKEED